MKNIIWSAFLVTFIASCTKIDESTDMNFTVATGAIPFVIPVTSSTTSGTQITDISASANLDELVKEKGEQFSAADVVSMKVTSLKLALTDTPRDATNNFANIEEMSIAIEAAGQPSVLLAGGRVPDNESTAIDVRIIATENEFKNYAADHQLRITGKLRRPTTKALNGQARISYYLQLKK
ncbi:hypothetical protein [Pedobacter deserti]|uniref:hypothetical protein n=1 Tax=Pedobacter deserti TaxID=2817382 RepID=UPI00210CCBF1|nr:hypothetical protein [Pedobacter sp. SYSU D00382]